MKEQSELIEITPDGNYIFCKAGRSVERWSLPNKFDKKSCFCGCKSIFDYVSK